MLALRWNDEHAACTPADDICTDKDKTATERSRSETREKEEIGVLLL